MGFGFLLVGYMLSFLVTAGLGPYIFAGMLIGSIFMFFGLKELRKYDPVFIYALIGDILLFICSVIIGISWALGSFTSIDVTLLSTVMSFVKIAVCIFFEISLLYGVADLSRRVDYPDTRQKAITNIIYVSIFNVYQIITLTPIVTSMSGENKATALTILMIAQVIYTAINTFLFFKCYAMICPAGQEDMPYKKSKFAFINKFREIRDAKDEKAINEMKNYYEDKLKRRNAKRNSKHSKKKKKR